MNIRSEFLTLRKKIIEAEFSRMNDRQRQAVLATQGPLLVLAGAGSGKTTVLVNRVACILKYGSAYESDAIPENLTESDLTYLKDCLEKNAFQDERLRELLAVDAPPAWALLAITFTNKAANEMKSRLENMLGEQAMELWACTFHSACSRILRREIDKLELGYSRSFTIYDTDDSIRVLRECCRDVAGDDRSFANKTALPAISRAKEKNMSPAAFELDAGDDFRLKKIATVYYKYQQALRQANALDFDDMLRLTVMLFEKNPDVLDHYARRFRYILVDEYQDTNPVQYKLISLLAGRSQNLCVVGDDDQSIYKFRGATIENILSFEKQFKNARVVKLEQNYRSTSAILDAANAVIANNAGRKSKKLWTENPAGDRVRACRFEDESSEALFIANSILDNVKAGMKFSDQAVIYRMNAQSGPIEKAFVRMGIPYRIIGGHRFYERLEIKDMMAYLCVINNPGDNLHFSRIVNAPKRSIGSATMAAVQQIAEQTGQTLYEVFDHCQEYEYFSKKTARIESFMNFLERMRGQCVLVPPHELIRMVMEESGYLSALGDDDEAKSRKENLSTLISNAADYEQNTDEPSLEGFLEEAALMTDIDNYDGQADTVVMMTIHAAKGLEFPAVFIAGMEEGVFPGQSVMIYPEQLEEERRLAYVGITRAKSRLTLTCAGSRMLFGTTVRNRPSRFLDEIPNSLKDAQDMRPHFERPQIRRAAPVAPVKLDRPGVSRPVQTKIVFAPGDAVGHGTFGHGLVLSAKSMGGDTLLEIAFDTCGTKKLMANFARLKKL
ncbi:ATP-dependent helicase [Ethanoligenens sp.]|uniref:ATP-dependent helicase n=1 Tax=Ethanoligenens sp. TaxID=2099655 RepID=UPI0039ED9A65